jgi:hypothetical protein
MAISAGALQAIVEKVMQPLSPGAQAEVLEGRAETMHDINEKTMWPLSPGIQAKVLEGCVEARRDMDRRAMRPMRAREQAAVANTINQLTCNKQSALPVQSTNEVLSPTINGLVAEAISARAKVVILELPTNNKEITGRELSAEEAASPTIYRLLAKAGRTIKETYAHKPTTVKTKQREQRGNLPLHDSSGS